MSATVFRLAAVALVAAMLVWSVLFVSVLRKRLDGVSPVSRFAPQLSSPDGGLSAQAPAPVTTRTS